MKYSVILASKSPRRQDLLKNIVPNFEIRTKDIEEIYPDTLPSREVPEFLSKLKSSPFLDSLKEHELLITSDTVVLLENIIYGKPKDRNDAIKILNELSGKVHEVITGVCSSTQDFQKTFSAVTKVHFKQLSQEEITYYVDHFNPYDKAGAYAIQEWIGMIAIEKIDGDYFNVMGLPLQKLHEVLKAFA
jgi:septum formation protein